MTPRFRVAVLVVAAAVIWAAMLPAAAYAAALVDRPAAQLFAFAVYGLGSAVCHQIDERSFHLFGEHLPVCARCTGLYAGGAAAAVIYAWLARGRSAIAGSAAALTWTARWLLALAAVPMAASLLYEWITGDVPSNAMRAGTGIVLGAAVAYVILAAVDSTR
jgi:uncharacterized membrane protein